MEEADAGWVRGVQGELEEGLQVQRGWDDWRAPEEGRDRPRSIYASCGRQINRESSVLGSICWDLTKNVEHLSWLCPKITKSAY